MKERKAIRYAIKNSPIELVLIAKSIQSICAVFLGDTFQDIYRIH